MMLDVERLDLPGVAARIRAIAEELNEYEEHAGRAFVLNKLANMIPRVRKERAPPQSLPVTAKMRDAVKAIYAAEPDRLQADVGHEFGVNPGRIFEILDGKYDDL